MNAAGGNVLPQFTTSTALQRRRSPSPIQKVPSDRQSLLRTLTDTLLSGATLTKTHQGKTEDICESTNLIRVQDQNSTPTLNLKAHGTLHRPDLTLISADLDNYTSTSSPVTTVLLSPHSKSLSSVRASERHDGTFENLTGTNSAQTLNKISILQILRS